MSITNHGQLLGSKIGGAGRTTVGVGLLFGYFAIRPFRFMSLLRDAR
ncbi:hypothetical protein [Bradyrhizobium acaciae]|nr:hypothetical protein [Bradyrhizobium acaciae]MCC8978099.1 hypothetical protein [Bradyrhizobium acaciae]